MPRITAKQEIAGKIAELIDELGLVDNDVPLNETSELGQECVNFAHPMLGLGGMVAVDDDKIEVFRVLDLRDTVHFDLLVTCRDEKEAIAYLRSLGNPDELRARRRTHPDEFDIHRMDLNPSEGTAYAVALIEKATRRVVEMVYHSRDGTIVNTIEYPRFFIRSDGMALEDITRAEFARLNAAAAATKTWRTKWAWSLPGTEITAEPVELHLESSNSLHVRAFQGAMARHGWAIEIFDYPHTKKQATVAGVAAPAWIAEIAAPENVVQY